MPAACGRGSYSWQLFTGPSGRHARRPVQTALRPLMHALTVLGNRQVTTGLRLVTRWSGSDARHARRPVQAALRPVMRTLGAAIAAIGVAIAVLAAQHGGASRLPGVATGNSAPPLYPSGASDQPSMGQAGSLLATPATQPADQQNQAQQASGGAGAGAGAASQHTAPQNGAAAHQQAAANPAPRTASAPKHAAPAPPPPDNQLSPAPIDAPQESMPVGSDQWQNAKTIVDETRSLFMGNRSAVIALATAMQESKLENLDYGDEDSLGLFQQRPSAGWGSPGQITDPQYAAWAFLHALWSYQRSDPAWATESLWMPAQGVQQSAFPMAYEQWEKEAAYMVWKLDQ
jgi:hypothetical protein